MTNRMAIILAAGKGTRMKSSLPKVLHPLSGLSMVEHVIRAVKNSQVDQIVTIIGNEAEQVREALMGQTEFALQEEQLGTAHAVQQAAYYLSEREGNTLVVCGDTPLLTGETLQKLFAHHEKTNSKATILTAIAPDSTSYGRIIRNDDNEVERIVEEKDASESEKAIKEINTGTYVFDNQMLFETLKKVDNNNNQGEYYLPDVIELLREAKENVSAYIMNDFDEAIGINDRIALSKAQSLMSQRINHSHMRNGVTFINPDTTYIEVEVTIGADSVIEGGVQLKGHTQLGQRVQVGSQSEIIDSQIADDVLIRQSVIENSQIASKATLGPFAHLRPNSFISEGVHIGNFVEVKNSRVGKNTRAGHLAYIGDATLGENVNVGCGVIFCNYDGKKKHHSTVGNDSFIGSNTNIVSPVNIGKRTVIAAGSTIIKDVADEELAISRAEQFNKANYWEKFKRK